MLDLVTLEWLWLTGMLSIVIAIPVLLGIRLIRQTALQHWWLGLTAIVVATSSTALCGAQDCDLPKILLENLGSVLGYALLLDAVLRMSDQKLTPVGLWLPPLAVALAQALQPGDAGSRQMLFSFVVCGQLFACSMLSLMPNSEISLRSRAVLALGFLFGCLSYGSQAWRVARLALSFQPDFHPATSPLFIVQTFSFLLLTSVLFVLLELERNDSQGRRLATLDGLTGIYNRRTLLELGQRELAAAQRRHRTLAVLMLDIDGLRRINEESGAFTGDRVLTHLAGQMSGALQRQDLFGRTGGDKFCAVLTETELDGARHVAERIRARVESTSKAECGIRYTISIGVCVRSPSELDIAQTIARAEAAMRIAHQTGNRIETDQASSESRAELSTAPLSREIPDQGA